MTFETWNKSLLSYKTRCTLYNLVIYYLKYYTIKYYTVPFGTFGLSCSNKKKSVSRNNTVCVTLLLALVCVET